MPLRTPSTCGIRPPDNDRRWRAWPVWLVVSMAACPGFSARDANAATTTPAMATASTQLADLLQSHYGRTASTDRHWTSTGTLHGQTYDFDHRVCANHLTRNGRSTRRLLAVCTMIEGGGHFESGRMDAYLLDETASATRIVAEARGLPFGTFGIPGEVEVVRLGNHLHGLRVNWRDAGSGHAFQYRSFVLPRGRSFAIAMTSIASHRYDGSGHCTIDNATGCMQARIDMTFDLRVDDSAPSRPHYPIRIHEQGVDCGRRIDRHHLLPFDVRSGTYPVEASLERGECLAEYEVARSTPPLLPKRPQDSTSP